MKFSPTASWRTRIWPDPAVGTGTSTTSSTSGPPARTAWIASIGLAQVRFEEVERALVRQRRRGFVIVLAAMTGEGVVLALVVMDGDLGVAVEGGVDGGLGLGRHEAILCGDMHQQSVLDVGGFAQQAVDADAVVGDGGVDVGAGRGQVGDLAAQAVAHGADLAGAA